MSTPDGFKRPKEYIPHMAMVKTPKELLMSELGLDREFMSCLFVFFTVIQS